MGAPRVGLLACALIGVAATPALADIYKSPTWAGYVAHRRHVSFSEVWGRWVQPSATCVPGEATHSSVWVGLGGSTRSSRGLEQVGTDVDCARSGAVRTGPWYELVPALSRGVRRQVLPGDSIAASVRVLGRRVRMTLSDLTRGWTFVKRLRTARIDTSSAEWVVESPSSCLIGPFCHPFLLTNFGTATFTSALVRSSGGHVGPILDARWRATRFVLRRRLRRTIAAAADVSTGVAATPGPLEANGTAFTVVYGTGSS